MIKNVIEAVNQTNQNKKELTVMDKNIFEIELEKLNEIIKLAKQGLLFQPIYENAFGLEADYYDKSESIIVL